MAEHVNFTYLTGIPGLIKKMRVTIIIENGEILVRKLNKIRGKIDITSVLQVEAKKETDFVAGTEKDKSVIGRALGGGLLLGPIGAVVGGMSGVGKKTKTPSKTEINWFVLIAYELEGIQNIAIFQSEALLFKEKASRKLVNDIITERQDFLSKSRTEKAPSVEQSTTGTEELASSEIEKSTKEKLGELKELLEAELITEEEYNTKREDILSKL